MQPDVSSERKMKSANGENLIISKLVRVKVLRHDCRHE